MSTTPVLISHDQIRRFRLRRSGLEAPFPTPEAVACTLGGVQAQILPAAGVALWNRTRELTHARYEELLFADRTLVKLWGQRGTLHVYPSRDWPLIYGMLAESKSWWGRTAEKEERYDAYDALVEQAAGLLRAQGTLSRTDLHAADLPLDDEHLSGWGGVFADLVRRGYACHAGREANEGLFAARESWLPDLAWDPPDVDTANLTMLRRYLHAYGPAAVTDFMYWRGGKAEPARRWWAALAGETVSVSAGGAPMALLADDLAELLAPADPLEQSFHLLYRFDPLLLAHKDKSWVVPPKVHKQVFRIAGHIEGVVLVRGQAVATWRYQRHGRGLTVTVEPFGRLGKRQQAKVAARAEELAAFFGVTLHGIEDHA